ncbi:MAG: hypothetical protein ACW99U_10170 [Candidatus Thorarchaeota archaeon]|jgi:hypothetical protein
MLTLKKIYHEFLEIEEKLDLFNKEIGAVSFWELVRVPIFFQLHQLLTVENSTQVTKPTRLRKYRFYLSSIINILRNPFFSMRKTLLFFGSPRRLLQDEYWSDIYTDPIIDNLELSYISIEHHFNLAHRKPAKTHNLRYFDFIDLLVAMRRVLGLAKIELLESEAHLLQRIQEEINDVFAIHINIRAIVLSKLWRRKARIPIYRTLLKHIQPKAVVIVTSYGKEALIETSKSLKIPVIELQHGVINQYHVAYSYPGPNRKKETFPDFLLTFGAYWTESVEYPVDRSHIIRVGYPFLEEQLNKYLLSEKKKQIVFLSQGTTGTMLSKLALQLSREDKLDYDLVYKLHPREIDTWRENYPWLIDSQVIVADTKEALLHSLLGESSIQVGVSSTALLEGLAFGLRTFILKMPGSEYFEDLIGQGLMQYISTAEDLMTLLLEHDESPKFDIERFFQSNAVENILAFIIRIIDLFDTPA